MPSQNELRAVLLGDEGAGKTTLLSTLARFLSLTGMPNDYYYEDLVRPRRGHIGGEREEKDPWAGGADVRAVTAEITGKGRTWYLTDLAEADHLAFLAALPRCPDAAIVTVSARTGLGREGIRQVRACGVLGIPSVIVYISLFGQDPSSRRVKTIQIETERLVHDYLGRWPVMTLTGNFHEAVRDMEAHPLGPFRSFLPSLAGALLSLDTRPDTPVPAGGRDVPCLLLNLEGTLNSVLSVPDGARVKMRFRGEKAEADGIMELRSGPEEARKQKAFLRSGECSEALVRLDEPVIWQGGARFFLEYEDRLRITGIAARRSAFPPFI